MRSCPTRRTDAGYARARFVGILVALLLAACAGGRDPAPSELEPFAFGTDAPVPLPDQADRTAARLATLALAGRVDDAGALMTVARQQEEERELRGEEPSGLLDDELHLIAATRGEPAYTVFAERMLESGEPDPALRHMLETHLDAQPLARAEQRIEEHRRAELATVVNRLTAPLAKIAQGGLIEPLSTTRAAISALLVTHSLPSISVQERQALHDYEDFLDRHPDAPEAAWVSERVRKYRKQLADHLEEEALEFAEVALDAGRPEAALVHLDRAARLDDELEDEEQELRERALRLEMQQESELSRSLRVSADPQQPAADPQGRFEDLIEAVLVAPLAEVGSRAAEWEAAGERWPLGDELAFLASFEALAAGDESAFYQAMEQVAKGDPAESGMVRHARRVVGDPEQNPYAYYRHALSQDRGTRARWIALGKRANGPADRDLPKPVEYLIDAPGYAVSIATFPLRLLQYPAMRPKFGDQVIETGERYLRHYPDGEHAEAVNRDLEGRYASRSQWSLALAHHEARAEPRPKTVQGYRRQIASRRFEVAAMHPRTDVRIQLYRSIVNDFGDTPEAEKAESALYELMMQTTPQNIRISREFLEEHPALWEPDALGLRPELFDGEADNGELAEEGLFLVGQTRVRVVFEDHEPVVQEIPPERFARFVALLEEESYRLLANDAREQPEPDLQRDLFFERARLGLLDEPDTRPTATSHAVFESSHEKYGPVRTRSSILPVELVLKGGLEDLGMAAYPRIKQPGQTPDAFLYR